MEKILLGDVIELIKLIEDNSVDCIFTDPPYGFDLCEYIIKTYTKKGDLLLDCFAGSGSLLYAAKKLGRNFIGIEKESLYYEKILNRLKNASANPF